jgi:hypothetical protein
MSRRGGRGAYSSPSQQPLTLGRGVCGVSQTGQLGVI